jgi:eukaryotic-like serine/threonine-protein kinase
MTPERWQRIKDLLYQAQQLRLEERSAFLDRSCASDRALRDEIDTLLLSSEEARSSFLEDSPVQVALMSGTRLGDYEVQKLLGSGGMGEVYRARDLRLRRDVAIKVLPSFVSSDKERLRRFEQEAQAAAALNHPNILAVFQMGMFQGAPYLVSELLEGETLRGHVNRGPLLARKAIDYGVQIALGLAAAHEKGIVHRDLKPENLFVTRDGRIKILDFGLAKLKQPEPNRQLSAPTATVSATEPGTVMGTVGYMSPEQVRGQDVDHRSDIFSLGTILYEMLTGRRAFQKTTPADTMSAILNEDPPPLLQILPAIRPSLQRVVQRCLEKNPAQRFHSASDLAFALEALSDSGVISTSHRTAEQISKKRNWMVAAAATVLLTSVAAWWMVPTPVPTIGEIRQLTDDGEHKNTVSTIVSDGSRVYFDEFLAAQTVTMQVSASGGESMPIPTTLKTNGIAALTPDSSALMLFASADSNVFPLLIQPLPTGHSRRLGEISASDADFFPDGRIVFTRGPALYVADKDGFNPHKIVDFAGSGGWPRVSPDGMRIRFTIYGDDRTYSLWEVGANGNGLHQMLKGWHESPNECCGKWTQDGRHFVFQYEPETRWDLWALQEGPDWLHPATKQPIALTKGPLSYVLPSPSRDNQQIFAVGLKRRGELVRHDVKTHQYVPYAGGPSAINASVSADGKWVVYTSYPDHMLWRSRPDGSERLQLTYPPLLVEFPQISPDGKKVAFGGFQRDKRDLSLYIVDIEGGVPEKITQAGAMAWSPDQRFVAFNFPAPGKHQLEGEFLQLWVVELATKKVSSIPNSLGMYWPFWPESNTLLALQPRRGKVMAYDFGKQSWYEFANAPLGRWAPSPDRKYLYSDWVNQPEKVIVRFRLADKKLETVLDLTELRGLRGVVDEQIGALNPATWVGTTPDGSVLLTRDLGSEEIYALKVNWP